MVRSRWWGRLFWLAVIGVLIVPSSAPPQPVHRQVAVDALLPRGTVYLLAPGIAMRGGGMPVCGRPEALEAFSCLRNESPTRGRRTVTPHDGEAALGEVKTVKWLLTDTDSRTAKLPATADEVGQRLLRAGYRLVTTRAVHSDYPATDGSIMHAIPIGTACLIGYQRTWDHVDEEFVTGTLPDGSCL
jgi:hypothetical protein